MSEEVGKKPEKQKKQKLKQSCENFKEKFDEKCCVPMKKGINKTCSFFQKCIPPCLYHIFNPKPSNYLWIFFIWVVYPFFFLSLLCFITFGVSTRYPKINDETVDQSIFSEARVRQCLHDLDSFGIKSPFTKGHLLTVNYIKEKINNTISVSHSKGNAFEVEVDYQQITDHFVTPLTNPVENIAVLIRNSDTLSENALLISSHYDTVFPSIGSSDDIHGVCVMLEILSNILSTKKSAFHNFVFLFTNLEELGLSGARTFQSHKWNKFVKRFINLDSMGGPGKSMLYRLTSHRLVREISSVSNVKISGVSNDFVGRSMSDQKMRITDYDFYRLQGIEGFDFAYFEHGFSYHTDADTTDKIDEGSIQLLGNIVHEMLDLYVYEEESPLKGPDVVKDDPVFVFSDFLGVGTQYFPEWLYYTMAIICLIVAVFAICYIIIVDYQRVNVLNWKSFFKHFFRMWGVVLLYFLSYILSCLLAFVFTTLSALFGSCANQMSFFAHFLFVIFTFCLSSLFGMLLGQYIVYKIVKAVFFYKVPYDLHKFSGERVVAFNFFVTVLYFFVSLVGPFTGGFVSLRLPFFLYLGVFSNFFTVAMVFIQNMFYVCVRKIRQRVDRKHFDMLKKTLDLAAEKKGESFEEVKDDKKTKEEKKVEKVIEIKVEEPKREIKKHKFVCIVGGEKRDILISKEVIEIEGVKKIFFDDINQFSNQGDSYILDLEGEKEFKFDVAKKNKRVFELILGEIMSDEYSEEFESLKPIIKLPVKVRVSSKKKKTKKDIKKEEDPIWKIEKVIHKQIEVIEEGKKFFSVFKKLNIDYRIIFIFYPVCIFICCMLSLYNSWLALSFQWSYMGKENFTPIPALIVGGTVSVFCVVFFGSFLPMLHRSINFCKLMSFFLFMGVLFSIILAALFPYDENHRKWMNVENYLNSADSFNVTEIYNTKTIETNFGYASTFLKASDVDLLHNNHLAFDYYKRKTKYSPSCADDGTCFIEIPEDSTMSRIFSYTIEKITENNFWLDINYNQTAWSKLEIIGDDYAVVWENTNDILGGGDGMYYKTNVLSNKWRGKFSLNSEIVIKMENIYNDIFAVPLIKEMFDEVKWMTMAGWEKPSLVCVWEDTYAYKSSGVDCDESDNYYYEFRNLTIKV